MKEIIENDLFDIAGRIKEIDDGYFIVFDCERKRFEIHNKKQRDTLCLVLDGRLDCSVLDKVRSTRREFIDRLIAEIEKHNAKLDSRKQQESFSRVMNSF